MDIVLLITNFECGPMIFFTSEQNLWKNAATCNICNTTISRGGNKRAAFNATHHHHHNHDSLRQEAARMFSARFNMQSLRRLEDWTPLDTLIGCLFNDHSDSWCASESVRCVEGANHFFPPAKPSYNNKPESRQCDHQLSHNDLSSNAKYCIPQISSQIKRILSQYCVRYVFLW